MGLQKAKKNLKGSPGLAVDILFFAALWIVLE